MSKDDEGKKNCVPFKEKQPIVEDLVSDDVVEEEWKVGRRENVRNVRSEILDQQEKTILSLTEMVRHQQEQIDALIAKEQVRPADTSKPNCSRKRSVHDDEDSITSEADEEDYRSKKNKSRRRKRRTKGLKKFVDEGTLVMLAQQNSVIIDDNCKMKKEINRLRFLQS